jgi:hypothetical protein
MENLRKKNETELQNKTEGQSSRIEQTEDRISELEDEMPPNKSETCNNNNKKSLQTDISQTRTQTVGKVSDFLLSMLCTTKRRQGDFEK